MENNLTNLLVEAWCSTQGRDVVLNPDAYESIPDSIPVGKMWGCPRSFALERRGENPPFPELHWNNSSEARMKIFNGIVAEDHITKELTYQLGADRVRTEVNIKHENPKFHGRLDAMIEIDGVEHIVEIKKTRSKWGSATTPLTKYLFQVLGYMIATGNDNGHIAMISHDAIHVWDFVPAGKGYVVVHNVTGEKLNDPINTPDYLNKDYYFDLVKRMNEHLEMDMETLRNTRPIDPWGDSPPEWGATWQCVSTVSNPTKTREGEVAPSCQFNCLGCFASSDSRVRTRKNKDTGAVELIPSDNPEENIINSLMWR